MRRGQVNVAAVEAYFSLFGLPGARNIWNFSDRLIGANNTPAEHVRCAGNMSNIGLFGQLNGRRMSVWMLKIARETEGALWRRIARPLFVGLVRILQRWIEEESTNIMTPFRVGNEKFRRSCEPSKYAKRWRSASGSVTRGGARFNFLPLELFEL